MGIARLGSALLGSCQKEEAVSSGLVLVAESMNGNQKMSVSGAGAYWMSGDRVNINSQIFEIGVAGSAASVEGDFNSGTNYRGVFPADIYQYNYNDHEVVIQFPSVYHYRVDATSRRQALDAPMGAYGTPDDGKLLFKHLTGAMNIQFSSTYYYLYIDSIIVIGNDNDRFSGNFDVDLATIDSFNGRTTTESNRNKVAMVFDETPLRLSGASATVQIPIPPTVGDTRFTIRVVGHQYVDSKATRMVYERTQTTATRMGRAKIGDVPVAITNDDYTTTGPLFATEDVSGTTYYNVSSPLEFKLMEEAVQSYMYDGLSYASANYRLTNDIDMSGIEFISMRNFSGILDGNGHTVSNLYVSCGGGDLGLLSNPAAATVRDITFDDLTVAPNSSTGSISHIGSIISSRGNMNGAMTIDGVSVRNFRVDFREASPTSLQIGGFAGLNQSDLTVSNSNISFADGQTYTANYMMWVGGIVSGYNSSSANVTVTNVSVDFNTLGVEMTSDTPIYFGSIAGQWNYSYDLSLSGNAIRGTVNITSEASNYNNHIATIVGEGDGTTIPSSQVDISEFTLTINGQNHYPRD